MIGGGGGGRATLGSRKGNRGFSSVEEEGAF